MCCISTGFAGKAFGQDRMLQTPVQIEVFTDRTLYIAGESVRFSMIEPVGNDSTDRILYAEIITPDGVNISKGKYVINRGKASGCLLLPRDMLSGYYYFRAYTRYMRNAGPSAYRYVRLKVVNPLKSDVLVSDNSANSVTLNIADDSMQTARVEIAVENKQFNSREKVIVTVKANPDFGSRQGLCVSVVPAGTCETTLSRVSGSVGEIVSGERYYHEFRGVTLTGTLVDKNRNLPIPDKVVTLSVMGDRDFLSSKTDQNGRFYFTLPDYIGVRELFLSSVDYSGSNVNLLIDNDFCSIPLALPNPVFELSEAENAVVLNLAMNNHISEEYVTGSKAAEDTVHQKVSFYGEPTEVLLMDKYVQLPTLEEYFSELPLEVKIRQNKEGKYFKFLSNDALMIVNNPIVLVDWVVITDIKQVLALSPQKIAKIEIVNKPYIKGNFTYGGIISIITNQGDFGGIDLPGSGLFIRYDFPVSVCETEIAEPSSLNRPDSRNTLLWLPFSSLSPGEESKLSFSAPDVPGKYSIILRGLLPNGKTIIRTALFKVVNGNAE